MKKTVLILTLFFSVHFSYGQTDSLNSNTTKSSDSTSIENKMALGIQGGSLICVYNQGLNYFLGVSVEKKRNFLAIDGFVGPKLVQLNHDGKNPSLSPNYLNGVNAVYQFTPNYKKRIFNIFFQYQFIYRFYHEQGNVYRYSYYNNTDISEPYKAYYSLIEHDLSLGFKIKFLKKFYFKTCAGFGYAYQNILIDYKHFSDATEKGGGFFVIASASLGYKFGRKK